MGRIVHTKGGGIAGRAMGLRKGELCKTCSSGCTTDCQRSGVHIGKETAGSYDFSISFKTLSQAFEPDIEGDEWDEGEPW